MSDAYGKIPAECPYGIRSFKTFRGHDGNGYECTVTLNGKAVFIAVDDGWGGGLQYHPIITDRKRNAGLSGEEAGRIYRAMNEAVEAMDTYAKTLPNYDRGDNDPECWPDGMPMSGELLVEELVNRNEAEKLREKNRVRFAKFCTTETLFRLKGDKRGSWRSAKGVGPAIIPALRAKYGDSIEVILNEAMMADAFAWEKF